MRSKICFAAFATILFVTAVGAQTQYVVSAGAKSGQFSVKSGGTAVSGAANISMDSAMTVIRKKANGKAVEINFDTAKGGVNIGESVKIERKNGVNPNWGAVTVTGALASTVTSSYGTLHISADTGIFNVKIAGKITMASKNSCAIQLRQNVALRMDACTLITNGTVVGHDIDRYCRNISIEINGGKYKSVGGSAIYSTIIAPVKITDGEFETDSGYAVRSRGALDISGGKFMSETGTALFFDNGEALITGGRFVSGTGTALRFNNGEALITGGAEFVNNSDTNAAIVISGGTVRLADADIKNNNRNGRAVSITATSSKLVFAGAHPPRIGGNIMSWYTNTISADSSFNPGENKYTLEFVGGACVDGAMAVAGGGEHFKNFLYENKYYKLNAINDDIFINLRQGIETPSYTITGDTATGFVASIETKTAGEKVIGRSGNIDYIIDSIRIDADGRPCGIRFGDGKSVLEVVRYKDHGIKIVLATAGVGWGRVTLTGKLSSTDSNILGGGGYALVVGDGVSVESRMDNPSAIGHEGSVWVGYGAEFIHHSGNLCGLINNYDGKATISGGTVPMISNWGESLKITGGTIGSDTLKGYAVYNYGYCVTYISGDASIISANTEVNGGTIESYGLLEITGGTITAKGNGYALVTDGDQGTVISGNTNITTASRNGAVYIGANGYLRLYGGTISSDAALNGDSTVKAIVAAVNGKSGAVGRLEMYGSPTVNGTISLPGGKDSQIKIRVDSGYVFNPRDRRYRISMQTLDGDVVVENGAGFLSNFALDAIGNKNLNLAVSGNDIVSAVNTCNVSFSSKGSLDNLDSPKTIRVVTGGTIGTAAMPSPEEYISKDGYYNDGYWYIRTFVLDGIDVTNGEIFVFGVGGDATKVSKNETLMLQWTDRISVLESNREIPAARNPETAAIAPVAAASGGLTVGPNPVSRSAVAVNFFRSGVALKTGKLFIYDASGNMVTTVLINDPSNSTGRRIVASWKINDANNRQIANGTYAARGVITTKTGKTERISILINVQR